jgi:hypothetical protein
MEKARMSDTPSGSILTQDLIASLRLSLEEMTLDRDYWKERATTDVDRRESVRPEARRSEQPSTQWKFWREARIMELEPYYCYWVSHLTSEGLHDKGDIATVLAILHQQRDDMQTTPCGCTRKRWR